MPAKGWRSGVALALALLCFLFQGSEGITGRRETFHQIRSQKSLETAEAFVLRCVNKFVGDKTALSPMIGANKNSVAKGQTDGRRRDEVGGCGCGCQRGMGRRRDLSNGEKSDLVRMDYTNSPCIFQLRFSQRNACPKNGRLLGCCPLGGERKQHFKLLRCQNAQCVNTISEKAIGDRKRRKRVSDALPALRARGNGGRAEGN